MNTIIVTSKGQIVIPSKIRKKLNIKKGTILSLVEKNGQIILQTLNDEYFEKMAGVLNTRGKLTKSLLEERRKDKALEEQKWPKS